MQPKEQPQMSPKESWPAGLPKYEDVRAQEKMTLKKLGNKLGDVARDIDTANKMAGDKFEGDSALMHTARGFVTTGIGVGLEKSMDYVWNKVWLGDIPFYDKSKFGEGMAEAFNKFANKNDLTRRLTYLIKEGTQDLSVALLYNFMAFRSQPILPKAGPEHLVRSLGLDVVEALTLPGVPAQVKDTINADQRLINESKLKATRRDLADALRTKETVVVKEYEAIQKEATTLAEDFEQRLKRTHTETKYEFEEEVKSLRQAMTKLKQERSTLGNYVPEYDPKKTEKVLQGLLNASNPVTMLGLEWIASGMTTLVHNFKEVRKARKEKGGLEGKKVVMPKSESHWKRDDRKPYQERKQWEKRDTHDKVYYGKSSKWEDQKKQEEYELKAG